MVLAADGNASVMTVDLFIPSADLQKAARRGVFCHGLEALLPEDETFRTTWSSEHLFPGESLGVKAVGGDEVRDVGFHPHQVVTARVRLAERIRMKIADCGELARPHF